MMPRRWRAEAEPGRSELQASRGVMVERAAPAEARFRTACGARGDADAAVLDGDDSWSPGGARTMNPSVVGSEPHAVAHRLEIAHSRGPSRRISPVLGASRRGCDHALLGGRRDSRHRLLDQSGTGRAGSRGSSSLPRFAPAASPRRKSPRASAGCRRCRAPPSVVGFSVPDRRGQQLEVPWIMLIGVGSSWRGDADELVAQPAVPAVRGL